MKNPAKLKIRTIKGEWCDKDIVMLHACFQLLTDCIEKENLLNGHIDWEQKEEDIQAKKELTSLYEWWKNRSEKELEDNLDPIWTKNQYEEDNEMLIKLIKVRKYLWT